MRAEHLLNHTIADYRLLEVLGKGGMGIVFLAQHLENSQDKAAIKILIPSDFTTTAESTAFQARFLREAQTVHQLQHEHILSILDYGEGEDGLFYMVMPLISGGTLAHKLALTAGLLPLDAIASYLKQLASAVDYSNQHGMVHRDIKPSNVLLDEQGSVYLADFGIVRLFDSDHLGLDGAPPTLTTTGKIYGTPAYMAPERFKGEAAEPATDIYALGILLYQLVTGQVPFDADNPIALGMKHLNAEPTRPRSLRPDLPEPAEAAILKALAKQPADRFATASALSSAFEVGLQGEWTEELLPLAAVLAAKPLEAQVKEPVAVSAIALADDTQPNRLAVAPAREVARNDLALMPTAVNVPVVARRTPHFWRNFQVFSLGMLVIVLLLFASLFALAIYKLGIPAPQLPGISIPSTSTSSTPTKAGGTPASTAGARSAPGSPAVPSPTTGNSHTTTPTPGTTPASTPTPGITPVTTPTPGTTPASTPTPGGTP